VKFTPSGKLTEKQIQTGLNLIVKDGLMAEAMATLTGGAFLVAMALKLGASNFQIGILAALPSISPIFQLLGIFLVQKYHNRKIITVISSVFARGPLVLICFLPFLFSPAVSLVFIIVFLFFHYLFGSVSGCGWNSWMKDLVPQEQLGRYFSNRSRLIQILSVTLSFAIAFILDYVKANHPELEIKTYSLMFLIGGTAGLLGITLLVRTPEPRMVPIKSNIFRLLAKPFKNENFRNTILFNGAWAFAVNLATPFFSVFLLKMLHLPLSYVVSLNILSQVTNILFIRVWGKYSDKYSNKSILRICGPVYLLGILALTFTTMPGPHFLSIPLLVVVYAMNGISVSGINLAMSNIGIKLAPKQGDAIVFLTARSMFVAAVSGLAPAIGGLFADFFAARELSWNLEWKSPAGNLVLHTLELQQWDFFFVFAFLFGLFALYRLSYVKEEGEVHKSIVVNDMVAEFMRQPRIEAAVNGMRNVAYIPYSFFTLIRRKQRIDRYRRRKRKGHYYTMNKNIGSEWRKVLRNAG
jgi:MFS family permease